MCQEKPNPLPQPKAEEDRPRPLADEALRRVTGGMRPIAASGGKTGAQKEGETPDTET